MSKPTGKNDLPRILCISGHDPSGGAGLQADIEAIHACGGLAQTLPTCLTVQTHREVLHSEPVTDSLFSSMFQALITCTPPDAIKLGLLASPLQVSLVSEWHAASGNNIPIIMDPVLRASSGYDFSDDALIAEIREKLLPRVTLLTPNRAEACRLANEASPENACQSLIQSGCRHLLMTGGDSESEKVINQLYGRQGMIRQWKHPRLPHEFHGSGCTLAAASACLLARGMDIERACDAAQAFTQTSLERAITLDAGPRLPRRTR